MPFDRVSIDPAKMGGAPRIRDLRITVRMVISRVAADGYLTDVLADHPDLAPEDITAALEFAAAMTDFHEVPLNQSA
jgi:uncharacterized protein (DUF433 family)